MNCHYPITLHISCQGLFRHHLIPLLVSRVGTVAGRQKILRTLESRAGKIVRGGQGSRIDQSRNSLCLIDAREQ